MAMRKTGSRPVVVDGRAYRWKVRRTPTYDQGAYASAMTITVQAVAGGAALTVYPGGPRPDHWLNLSGGPGVAVTPAYVADAVRRAIAQGWRPGQNGPPFAVRDRGPRL